MTKFLMPHRIPSTVTPLGDWLQDVKDELTLITCEEAEPGYRGRLPHLRAVSDYSGGSHVDRLLDDMCAQGDVEVLVHVTEDDILRCARVRDRYDIPGLRYEEALPWRDKYVMKQAVRAHGIPAPDFVVPATAADARRFAGRAGWPVVVKPRLGYASHGVRLVHDPREFEELAAQWDPEDVMLESFTEGDVLHVDGFTQDGKVLYVSVSRYVGNCLSFHETLPLGSVQLDRDGEEHARLAEFAERVVEALPRIDFSPFHLEVFRRPGSGDLEFCEIACRLGGAHIMETLTYATGVNPARLWIRHQLGLETGPATPLNDKARRYGWLLIPPRNGRLLSISEPPDAAFIKDFIVKTPVPRVFDGAHGSTDSYLAFVVEGEDEKDVESKLHECIVIAEECSEWEGELHA
ncbi:acetyl-CoA carboxylase biotin carboxylase subunit family protein [Streptomyces sp. WMMB 322]|uniref:ATP-grasp domain-containing protein n=1 Tax=Streptomyces sp. WMMB 322 TaxID=1286821 RepID=UPI0006E22BEF|nr:ATP-grasp domain-containing protein [Streptomyces sp. WMMB 322]SCK10841.1 ATP-grasp domain-containing protein [Streptomyces sp. WMMB 322]